MTLGYFLEASGFVYGFMSFLEKLSSGAAIMLIQQYMPSTEHSVEEILYFRWILVYGCGGAAIVGLVMVAILYPMKIGQR